MQFCRRENVSAGEVLMSVLFKIWNEMDPDGKNKLVNRPTTGEIVEG